MSRPEHKEHSAGSERHRQPAGTEPVTARSPLRLRALLSAVALTGGTVLAIVFGLAASGTAGWVVVAIGAATALIAAVDLWVIARRVRQDNTGDIMRTS
jgi:membrane protein YdbS with pleckstrin-like domain